MIVIDATDQILGRMASMVAKRLLNGETITIVNTEKAVVSGDPKGVIDKYRRRFDLSRAVNPRRGPFYPRSPDRIVGRTVRGMLPWSKPRGKEAFRRLRVHRGVPESLSGKEMISFQEASAERIGRARTTSVWEISIALGMKKEAVM